MIGEGRSAAREKSNNSQERQTSERPDFNTIKKVRCIVQRTIAYCVTNMRVSSETQPFQVKVIAALLYIHKHIHQ